MNSCSSTWNALTRKKLVNTSDETKLARVLNLFDLTALGVGSTLGLGVYVLAGSVAHEQAGPAVVISFLLAAIASAFAGLCYAEFAARVPKAGSAYIYSYVTVGEFVAFTIGWNLILEYVIGASSVARGLSGYIDALTGNKMGNYWLGVIPMKVNFLAEYPDILSFTIVTILTIILAVGVKESSFVQSAFTVINMLTIFVVIIAGSIKAQPSYWFIAKEDLPNEMEAGDGGFMPFGFSGILAGAAKCFYGFVGFDCVATAGEEAKNAKRNIPLAMILTLLICVAVYIAISTILTMVWPYYLQNPEAPFPHVFEQIGWYEIKWTVSIGAVFALCTSLLGAMYSLPRVLYAMSSDGVLFRFMSRVNQKTKTPVMATLISGMFSALMAAVFSLHQLVDMLSIGTLLAYTIVSICVLVLRYECIEADEVTRFSDSTWKNIFRWHASRKPTTSSSNLTKILVVIFSMLSIVLGCLVSYVDFTVANIVAISIVGVTMIAAVFLIFYQPVDKKLTISFKVPFVPFLPCFSIFCNIFLMLQLDGATWIRFGVWLFIGYFIYFVYGIRTASSIRKSSREIIYKN
ncbi:High affinity cationic amino acid transporter 1 [Pseudolycoriella hygida]|uniref:High affinity cationic amino acid transporter 1 n=1 Tax=Pseudolycoriella hygida TaxID=35572 RepID=A0A9Q0N6Y2_9DIPT|nr:High affinity cationic amino acid transporter 1 [Pseudolycoriella hygida]